MEEVSTFSRLPRCLWRLCRGGPPYVATDSWGQQDRDLNGQ